MNCKIAVSFICLHLLFLVSCDIHVDPLEYVLYKQKQVTKQHNHFEIHFKTIDASGVLLFAKSAGKNDYMTVELIKGKIRYAGEFGKGVKNVKRQVVGYHEMFVGDDLADNRWHKVEITQVVRDITIVIDGRKEPKYFNFRKMPPVPTDFSVEKVYVGGMYSFTGITEKQSMAKEGLNGCIRGAKMNGIDLLSGSNQYYTPGILRYCPTVNYYPIFFPNSVSHLSQRDYKSSDFRVKLDFRTNILQQVMVNYTYQNARFQLGLTRKGKVYTSVDINGNPSRIETAKKDFNDGQWHTLEYYLSNKAPSYEVEFIVDGVKRKSRLGGEYKFNGGPLNFGFGYTGCMKNLVLNKRNVDYTRLENIATMFGKCNLKDFCTPNPCLHGGKCNQTDSNFLCECRHTPYTGSCCTESRFNRTCMEIREKGEVRSDNYYLDMDGVGAFGPVKAFCIMGKTPEDTITQINATDAIDKKAENPSGRFEFTAQYTADEKSLRDVLIHHQKCEQFIKYRCIRSYLFKSPRGPPKARWLGLDDRMHYYWGGSGGKRYHCACGIAGTCVGDGRYYCNCDAKLEGQNRIIEDSGYLTIKKHLPVRSVQLFDVDSEAGNSGLLTVGPLRCRGFGGKLLAATFREPYSYLEIEGPRKTDYNNILDAGVLSFEFKTVRAAGIMAYARGPISGDYVKVQIVGRTRMRTTINLGYYKDIYVDVEIRGINRTFDDNLPHHYEMGFNRKEMNVTVDNITRTVGFEFRFGITHLNLDGSSFYVGGSIDDQDGFVGCMRNFIWGGKLFNLPQLASDLERIGVYLGCGSACKLVSMPCNHGFCIDEYSNFTCNCSVSPFSGNHCQIEPNARLFRNGQYVQYDFNDKQMTIQESYITAGFKTRAGRAVIFQLHGDGEAHITLLLVDGILQVLFKFDAQGASFQTIEIKRPFGQKGYNDDLLHVVRVHHKGNRVFVNVDNMTDEASKVLNITVNGLEFAFPKPQKLYAGKLNTLVKSLPADKPTTYVGCMVGVKYQYFPVNAQIDHSIDLFELLQQRNTRVAGTATKGRCMGRDLPVPGPLPTVFPPPQFRTIAPTRQPIGPSFSFTKLLVVGLIALLVIVVVILFGFTCRCIEKYNQKYKPLRNEAAEYRRTMKGTVEQPRASYQKSQPQPAQQFTQPQMKEPTNDEMAASYPLTRPAQAPARPAQVPARVVQAPGGGAEVVVRAPQPSASNAAAKSDDDWFL